MLDRALRGVRKDLARVERQASRNAERLETLEAAQARTRAELRTVTAQSERVAAQGKLDHERVAATERLAARLNDALSSLRSQHEAELAEVESRLGALTQALIALQREGAGAMDTASLVVETVIDGVLRRHLTYLGRPMLRDLADVVRAAEEEKIPGVVIETGCAKGGSAIVMGAAKSPEREFLVYDVFGMIPAPGEGDDEKAHSRYVSIKEGTSKGIKADKYYGYEDDLLSQVRQSFTELGVAPDDNNVTFVAGLFQDTVNISEPVAVAHLDGDWYESTLVCLERIGPWIAPRGRIVLDDYYFWAGCQRAVDEWLPSHPEFVKEDRSRLHLVRRED